MRYLVWLFRVVIFIGLLGFAVKNDQPVALHYFFGYEWQASLVVILLLFFAIGMGIGVLGILGNLLRQRREIGALKRELSLKKKPAGVGGGETSVSR
ncbi:MAG: LapA family protein, partial [Nitrosomonadales bacterium]